jgi:hypothetical protein
MGTTLTGTQIQNTYDGLIKTTDNTAITATTKLISDGLGNDTCIKVGTAGTDFLGAVDFSAATVTGLPGGAAGLVSGTGADSLKNADSLVTTPATAAGACSIALGDGATTTGTCAAISIGLSSSAGGCSVALGPGAVSPLPWSVAVGRNSTAGASGVSIGNGTNSGSSGVSIGPAAKTNGGAGNVAIAQDACATQNFSIAIGLRACTTSTTNVALGSETNACAAEAIHIGGNGQFTNYGVFADGGTVIGVKSCVAAGATCAVALGYDVTAATADTVSVKALETQTASTPTAGGIIMNDAGSVARRLNIDASGNLQIDSTPVGGGGAAGLVSGTGTDSLKNADSLVTNPASAAGVCSVALGDGANAGGQGTVAIGLSSNAGTSFGSVAVGQLSGATGIGAIGIGYLTNSGGTKSISLGYSARATGANGIALGEDACALSTCSVAIGSTACVSATSNPSVAIGCNSRVLTGDGAVAIGNGSSVQTSGTGAVAIGKDANAFANAAVGIGWSACANACGAVALGFNILATRAFTTASCQFEALEDGKGVVVTSPDGLTTLGIGIDNTGAIVTYTP